MPIYLVQKATFVIPSSKLKELQFSFITRVFFKVDSKFTGQIFIIYHANIPGGSSQKLYTGLTTLIVGKGFGVTACNFVYFPEN